MGEKEIGKVEKYFSHVGVGVINLTSAAKASDTLHIKGHTTDFTQKIESMQVEHKPVEEAFSGSSIGIKLKDRVRPGDTVYLVTEQVEKKIRANVFISGRVQGVFFRYTTQLKAQEKGLTGWVRNLSSGEVECLFEGDEDKIRDMIEWCYRGPSGARVENVKVAYHKYLGEFDSFFIR